MYCLSDKQKPKMHVLLERLQRNNYCHTSLVGCKMIYPMDGNLAILEKLHLPFVLESSCLRIYPMYILGKIPKYVCTRLFIAVLVITKTKTEKLEPTKMFTSKILLELNVVYHSMNSLPLLKGMGMISTYYYGAISWILYC